MALLFQTSDKDRPRNRHSPPAHDTQGPFFLDTLFIAHAETSPRHDHAPTCLPFQYLSALIMLFVYG
jgi:hypothetical protein